MIFTGAAFVRAVVVDRHGESRGSAGARIWCELLIATVKINENVLKIANSK